MQKRVVFIAKTNLNTDGRILNEMRILQEQYSDLKINFILLPDKPFRLSLKNVNVFSIKCHFRHNKVLRPLTASEFSFKAIFQLLKLSPDIIHVQDSSVIFPVYLYCKLKRKRPVIIYDDHEIPNNFESRGLKGINRRLENQFLKTADAVIFANAERQEYLKRKLGLKNQLTYFLNLPYYEDNSVKAEIPKEVSEKLVDLDRAVEQKIHFIMHQGVIKKERGEQKLAEFSKMLPPNLKIMIVGETTERFNDFIDKWKLNKEAFHFVGTVDYFHLVDFWNRCVASIIIYLPDLLNNRLCAPNRFYLALQKRIPVIVNESNPVLSNFVNRYKCGFFIEKLNVENVKSIIEYDESQIEFSYERIRSEQVESFISIYSNYLK